MIEMDNFKKTFKDKIKDRISTVKQKSSNTLMNARARANREKHTNNIDFQQCVESFLPQLHHENEIEEALENIAEMGIKDITLESKEQRKKEFDFFTLISNDEKSTVQSKRKKKKSSPSVDIVSSAEHKEDNDEQKKPILAKTALRYFDTEINDCEMVTPLIISKVKTDAKVHSLFWDGKENTIQSCQESHNIADSGFFVGSKPKLKSIHLRGILSHSDDQIEWFDSDGQLLVEDNPVYEMASEIRFIPSQKLELKTEFVKSTFFAKNMKKTHKKLHGIHEDISNSVLELNLSNLMFNHHPLFSLEHVIAQRIIKTYDLYCTKQSERTINKHDDILASLRRTKSSIKKKILLENNNSQKKLYKDAHLRKYTKEITKVRNARFEEALSQKHLENEILKLWRNIKLIRKQLKYTSTNLVLEIIKNEVDIEEDRRKWEEMFEMEVNDVIDELKCEYLELKSDYVQKSKKPKNSSPDSVTNSEHSQKPKWDYDEVKIRKTLFNEMCEIFRQPGEPILCFKLSHSLNVITEKTNSVPESSRRNDVEKTKMFLKLFVNTKEVCKTNDLQLNQDFKLPIDQSFSVQLPDIDSTMKILLYEQSSFLPSIPVGEIVITIPKKNILISETKNELYPFLIKNKRTYSHSAVGTCTTLSDLINKKYSQGILYNIDLDEKLICEGLLELKIGWTTNAEEVNYSQTKTNNSKSSEQKGALSAEMMSKLSEDILDPNDPKNYFLISYMKNFKDKPISSGNFFLNTFFNFDFLLKRYSDSHLDVRVDQKNVKEVLLNNMEVIPNDGASTSTTSRPRGSVLDDASVLNRILDPIDLQRRTSIRYLQLVNEHLSLQNEDNNKDKQLSDIVTVFTYPGIKTITLNFLRPKRPLFYQTKQQNFTPKPQVDTVREYTLKVCILKAFQLPCRSETVQAETSMNSEGGLKMINLKPFVRVTCQGKSLRTSTAMGNNPTWNEQLCFPVRYNTSSVISIHLFDELFKDLLADNRLEDSTIYCQYSANWLGSMKILLPTVFSQTKIEGTFLMYSPPELLGYKNNVDEKYAHSHISYDSSGRDINFKQREGFFISMFFEIFPSYIDTVLPIEILETNEMDYMIKYLNTFTENYENAFPKRKINLLVLDTSGKYICITRLFKSIPLPEFGEYLANFYSNHFNCEESTSSKNSTPNRKKSSKNKNSDEVTSRSIKSVMSTNIGEGRRQSKATKDVFEMKSLDENITESGERGLVNKVQFCARFVAMIPLFELNILCTHLVALSGYQTLRLVCGSMMDHTILLMNYFLYLGINCWFVSGQALPRGLSSYVLVKENQHTKEIGLKDEAKTYSRLSAVKSKNVWKYFLYDATTGLKYDTQDPFCPLQKVYLVCNTENIWVNVQPVERCNLIRFDFNLTSDWRPVFQKGSLVTCPGPLPGISSTGMEESLYIYNTQDVQRLRDAVDDKIRNKIQRWRGHRRTIWNRHCSSVLKNTLIYWEKWSLNQSTPKPKHSHRLQQLLLSYQVYGFPFNTTYISMSEIISSIKATQIHLDEHSSTEFALGVEVFPYPNNIYSVWIYLASVIRK